MDAAKADNGITFDDLSGLKIEPGENPYAAFIAACGDDPATIQEAYDTHRTTRNAAQKAKFLAFPGLSIDPILVQLEQNNPINPSYKDPRNCLVLWARPPEHILQLASEIQKRLQAVAPNIWLMPPHRMHMTTLEITYSKTAPEISQTTTKIRPHLLPIVNLPYTYPQKSRLVKPLISYDASAFALSFLPAAGEARIHPEDEAAAAAVDPARAVDSLEAGRDKDKAWKDAYTYHHLRSAIYSAVKSTGTPIASRYQVPSAHITLGRYLVQDDHSTPESRLRWTEAIDDINNWLETKVWTLQDTFDGEWIVGQERGLDARCGTLWYGGGRSLLVGEGF